MKNKIIVELKLKLIVFFAIVLLLHGCGDSNKSGTENKEVQKMVTPDSLQMKPLTYRGMYSPSADTSLSGSFYDCSSNKTFVVASGGEIESIEEVYEKMPSKKPDEKVYLELEGFISHQPKSTGKDLDTVLVITRFFKFDRANKCD